MTNSTKGRALLAAMSTLALMPAAHAQNGDDDVIVVTARLRPETMQDAPLSVDVVTAEALQQVGATSMMDLPDAAPGLILQKGPNSSQSAVSLRGLGSAPGVGSFESSVGLFVNGAYIPRTREFNSALFDIERIEVVSGTQASLLGKNTSLGAINVTTRRPGSTFGYNVSASHEGELGSFTTQGGVDIPLGENLSLRIAGQYEDLGGWVSNSLSGIDAETVERSAGRLSLSWTPSADVSVDAVYEHQDSTASGAVSELIAITPILQQLAALAGYPGLIESDFDRVTQIADSRIPASNIEDLSADRASVTLNWDIGRFRLTSLTSLTRSESEAEADVDFIPGNYSARFTMIDAQSFSQEVRLASPADRSVRYVVGGFYGTNTYDETLTADTAYLAFHNGTTVTEFDQSTESLSGFGQLDIDLSDRMTLTTGVRVTEEEKDVDIAREQTRYVAGPVPGPIPLTTLSRDESAIDGVVTLSYDVTDTLMVYGSWAQGTKSGGFANSATDLVNSEYRPEVAQTIEFGVRFQTADRRLTANATVFNTQVEDYQLVTFNGVQFVIDNTNLESTGIETEILWRPEFADGLRITWNNTYADAQDADTGAEIPRAPLWSGNVAIGYERPAFEGWTADINASASYRSSMTHQQDPAATPRAPSLTTLGAGIGLQSDSGIAFRLIGRNLTDENSYAFAFPVPLSSGGAAALSERPRTVMFQVSFNY